MRLVASDRPLSVDAPERRPAAGGESWDLRPPGEPAQGSLFRMFRFERRWLLRVFETLLPGKADPRLVLGAADVPMGRFVDDLLAHSPLEFVMGLRLVLWVVLLAPPFFLRRFRTFLGLSVEERMLVLDRLRTSDSYIVREAPLLLKTIACLGFCGLPQVQRNLGIHPTDGAPPGWAAKDGGAP